MSDAFTESLSVSPFQATSHSSAMLTTEGAHTVEHDDDKMDTELHRNTETATDARSKMAAADPTMEEADMMRWTEAEFEEKCTYIVKDTPQEPSPDSEGLTRAEASLPRNLVFKHPASSKEVSRNTHTHVHSSSSKYRHPISA